MKTYSINGKTQYNENILNSLLNKRYYLYKHFNNINSKKVINNSVNKDKKSKLGIKYYFFTQVKNKRNSSLQNSKNILSTIKCVSFKNLFNIESGKTIYINNKKNKNNFPKLSSLLVEPKKENNNINNLNMPINNTSRKFSRNNNFYIENNLSTYYLTNNKYKSYNKSVKELFILDEINQTKYMNNLFKNDKIKIREKNDKEKVNKKLIKKSKHFYSSDKLYTSPNFCDASTNTLEMLQNKNIYKRNRIPLMIDYFYSEHKKFGFGFDKLKGKNRNKKPFFIVHKY